VNERNVAAFVNERNVHSTLASIVPAVTRRYFAGYKMVKNNILFEGWGLLACGLFEATEPVIPVDEDLRQSCNRVAVTVPKISKSKI
jgi:hypothetical protein